MASTTTGHVKRVLEKHGYWYGLVERYVPFVRKRYDFCGFADVIAFKNDPLLAPGCLAVQSCSGSGMGSHYLKITEDKKEQVMDWILSGNRLEIWAWRMIYARNLKGVRSKKKKYLPIIRRIVVEGDEFAFYEDSEVELYGWRRV